MHEHKQNQCKRKAKHRKNAMKLIYKEKADSEDGYLGMYLFLMGKYLEKTESTDLPEYWKKGISLALKKIQSLMQDGITQVLEENTTAYLMDNLEVWKGLYELELAGLEILHSHDDKSLIISPRLYGLR